MEIGGYFELELRKGSVYHPKALELNSGRNAFEYILKAKGYTKVYLPYFTCASMLEPIRKLRLEHAFYHINKQLEPIFDYSKIGQNEAFVYTNYFGLFDHIVLKIVNKCSNLIIDNSQAFYSRPLNGVATFYSARKFFGVPDGAYLYINDPSSCFFDELSESKSSDRFDHLLKRIESGAEAGYSAFKQNEQKFAGDEMRRMSFLTSLLLESIDYKFIANRRRANFRFLHKKLSGKNQLDLVLEKKSVPLVYPFLTDKDELKSKLIEHKIYVATYWPNVLEWCDPKSLEYKLAKNTLHLPLDQRLNEQDLLRIFESLNKYL